MDTITEPTAEEIGEATSEVESPVPDIDPEEMRQRILNEFANRPNKTVTIQELFDQSVALVAAATGKRFRDGPHISETSAVKLYELALMWALNNRQQQPS